MWSRWERGRFWSTAQPPTWYPCFQNPVPRGRPAHHPRELPKHKRNLVMSLPGDSTAPAAPKEKTKPPGSPSALLCARAPCPARPSTPLPAARPSGCSPHPAKHRPPHQAALRSRPARSQPHNIINICLHGFLSPTERGAPQGPKPPPLRIPVFIGASRKM